MSLCDVVVREYWRQRGLGWDALRSLSHARTRAAWDEAESDGLVRMEVCASDESYDDSYIDTWHDVSPGERKRARAEVRKRVELDGCWGVRVYARKACGDLHEVGAVWGFIGDDWRDSGYDSDLMLSALESMVRP